jgi:hypothetical protein
MTANDSFGSFSAFCTRVSGPREIRGTVQLTGGALVFRPEKVGADAPITMPAAEILSVRYHRGNTEIVCVHGRRKLRLQMLAPLADRLFDALRTQCLAADVVDDQEGAGGRADTLVSERVQLEVNTLITVSAQITVTTASVRVEVGIEGTLLGRRSFEVPLAEIASITRADAGRRVTFHAGERSFVVRGVGAQRAWLVVRALADGAGVPHAADPVFVDAHIGRLVDTTGMVAVGARSFGIVSLSGALFADGSFWADLGDWFGTSTGPDGVELRWKGGGLLLTGADAAELPLILAARWIARGAPQPTSTGWRAEAVWFDGADVTCGVLSVTESGLLFRSAARVSHVIVPRGSTVSVRIDPHDAKSLRVVVDGAETRFVMQAAMQHARVLETLFASNAWAAPTVANQPHMLSEASVARLSGPAAYVRILVGEQVVAERRDCFLSPDTANLRMQLDFLRDPTVPAPVTLELANARGRFVVGGTLTRAAVTAPNQARRRAVQVVFGSEVRPANRRSFFRLPLRERIARVELEPPEGHGGEELDVRLMNVSRRGCALVLHHTWPAGSVCVFTAPVEGGEIELLGNIVQIAPLEGEVGAFRAGIRYLDEYEDAGVRLFLDRELEFLRKRAKDREEV